VVRVKRYIRLAGVYEVRPEHAPLKAFASLIRPIFSRLTQCEKRPQRRREKQGTRQIKKIRGRRFKD
jgi:hypothetical protein